MINPVGARVLVKPEQLEDVDSFYKSAKAAGIAIPDSDEHRREKMAVNRGTVVRICEKAFSDRFDGTPWCKVGDKVVYAKYGGMTLKDGDVQYVLLNDEDILAVIGEDND